MMESVFYEAAVRLRGASHVVAFTGAGISAESGLPVYRGPGGIWTTKDPNFFGSPRGWEQDPALMCESTEKTRALVRAAQPNPAHLALAELEPLFDGFTIVTQNVDGLHQRAGSSDVLEVHGSLFENVTVGNLVAVAEDNIDRTEMPYRSKTSGKVVRPGVVYFGELLPEETLWEARRAMRRAQVLVVIGTSLVVEPAASLTSNFFGHLIEINLEPTNLTKYRTNSFLQGSAAYVLPKLRQELLAQKSVHVVA